ncbi:MAG: hypothetical protein EP346_06905 [Bacteroidetes bacterium]|nr:MAG: hypothetical protein EP346_06905 [Bacteroidota bacterium]
MTPENKNSQIPTEGTATPATSVKAKIHFIDEGQDLTYFEMDENGIITDAGIFHKEMYEGNQIVNFRSLIERGFVVQWDPKKGTGSSIKYPIERIEWRGNSLFKPVTKKQIKYFKTFLSHEPHGERVVHTIIRNWTVNRTHHISEVSDQEFQKILSDLVDEVHTSRDKQRKRVISHLAEAGFTTPDGKPDMNAINNWVEKQKYKKRFNHLNGAQLSELIYAAAQVKKHHLS